MPRRNHRACRKPMVTTAIAAPMTSPKTASMAAISEIGYPSCLAEKRTGRREPKSQRLAPRHVQEP
jgi:hypothetical protein